MNAQNHLLLEAPTYAALTHHNSETLTESKPCAIGYFSMTCYRTETLSLRSSTSALTRAIFSSTNATLRNKQ